MVFLLIVMSYKQIELVDVRTLWHCRYMWMRNVSSLSSLRIWLIRDGVLHNFELLTSFIIIIFYCCNKVKEIVYLIAADLFDLKIYFGQEIQVWSNRYRHHRLVNCTMYVPCTYRQLARTKIRILRYYKILISNVYLR